MITLPASKALILHPLTQEALSCLVPLHKAQEGAGVALMMTYEATGNKSAIRLVRHQKTQIALMLNARLLATELAEIEDPTQRKNFGYAISMANEDGLIRHLIDLATRLVAHKFKDEYHEIELHLTPNAALAFLKTKEFSSLNRDRNHTLYYRDKALMFVPQAGSAHETVAQHIQRTRLAQDAVTFGTHERYATLLHSPPPFFDIEFDFLDSF